ncbi:hippurate hydrolase [Pseudomonas sp. M47T1]|uniref:M20 aminoacylase family protein n=1 Tax=unclassified Pseudomonas TaxID=196821 RepID=UPI0002608251|nr:M20 aminoacylase family protein [Pseudomonas sp. M47T1]EIK98187.1 hippurate hydrolase [Pseudomonas sp. M47T1]
MSNLIINQKLQASAEHFASIRRDIHTFPELGGDVPRTAGLVAEMLGAWGYEVHTQVGGHGVVGVLKRGTGSRSLGIRADMDALPILEKNGLPWASQHQGRMHACGHDGHTATLLAAAEQLALHAEFDGTLNLIFQPDEEGLAGAKQMIDDGLFTRFPCDAVYAYHNMPGVPVGKAVVQAGGFMASSERVTITLTGRGGHGAMPERAIDPVPALASIITALQTVISRNLSTDDAAVISVGMVQAGTAYNIIPETANVMLSVRTADPAVRDRVEKRIREIVEGQAASFGVKADIDYQLLAPVLVNSAVETERMLGVAREVLGVENVLERMPVRIMGSEDFAWMLHEKPGCYFVLGNGTGEFVGCSVHNDHYDFNDAVIPLGAACWVGLVEGYLKA